MKKVCIFYNQKMHFYLIYKTISKLVCFYNLDESECLTHLSYCHGSLSFFFWRMEVQCNVYTKLAYQHSFLISQVMNWPLNKHEVPRLVQTICFVLIIPDSHQSRNKLF